jgi:SAM-dependent methyltransferase
MGALDNLRRGLYRRVIGQFGRPSGALGALAGVVMATRASNRRRNAWTVDLLEVQPDHQVLEIGYGPGLSIRRAAELATRGRVVGIDHSEVMRRQARRRNRRAVAAGRVELLRGEVADLPAPNAYLGSVPVREGPEGPEARFDRVLAVNVFMFWPDPVALLRQVAGVMAPGGRIALTMQPRVPDATDEHAREAGQRMAAALGEAGFVDVQVRTLELQPVNAVCALGTVAPLA